MAQTSNKKRTLLELSLSRIPDAYVRAGFEQVQFAVNRLLSQGLETLGFLKARSVEAQTGDFSKGLEAGYLAFEETVEQRFMVRVERGHLNTFVTGAAGEGSSITYTYPRKVLGVIGWSQKNNGSTWVPMESTSSDSCHFSRTLGGENVVGVLNGDTSDPNDFKIMVFLEGKT